MATAVDNNRPIWFEAEGIAKFFGGQAALKGVDVSLGRGEVLGLIGENGAGKSTFLNIACGVFPPDAGELRLRGETIAPRSYHDANALGIFRVFQEPALIDVLPVYENMFFGWEDRFRTRAGVLARPRMRRRTRDVLEELGVKVDVRRKVGGLTPGARQSLDIARVVGLSELLEIEHPVVLFDEPTSALDQEHEENFLGLLERLRDRAAVVFVSHRLPEVLRTCGRVVVLKDGEKTAERATADAVEADLHHMMVGRVREANYYRIEEQRPVEAASAPRIELTAVSGAVVRGATLAAMPGEVLGIAGTEGSGKRELGEIIGGIRTPDSGTVKLAGRELRGGIAAAVKRGVGYVPPDRQHNGLMMDSTIVSNVQLPSLADRLATRFGGIWRRGTARHVAGAAIDRLGIVARGIDAPVSTLSGGNAQKVLLAKWLMRDPKLLVLDNPTQGVDTGAREGIYQLVRVAAAEGTTVVVIGDDLPELIGLSNRILVVTNGEIVESFEAPVEAKPSEQDIVARMIPASTDPPADPAHPQTNGN